MLLKVYTIFDSKVGVHNPPVYKRTHGEAEREFKTIVNSPSEGNQVNMYPEDYDLFYIGDFDQTSGLMVPLTAPQHIIKASQLKDQKH